MKLGIIGAGDLGGAVGRAWAKAGHEVILSSRHPDRLQLQGAQQRTDTIESCIADADVLLLATPYAALPDVARRHAAALSGKVVLDATNPEPGDHGELAETALRDGMAQTTQAHLPGARLVRAFSSINASSIDANSAALGADGSGAPPEDRLAIPVAGDDGEAVALACDLVRDAGCIPVVTGDLASARVFQWGNPGCLVNDNEEGLRRAMGMPAADPKERKRT